MQGSRRRIIILGAAGRDFHNFNTLYRYDPSSEVVAFTATQIPGIEGRVYPPSLAGPLYPNGIPIVAEEDLAPLIREKRIDLAVFSYSDVSYEHVMRVAAVCNAAGCGMLLPGPAQTMLRTRVPVIAVTAVRTGAGKSQTTRFLSRKLAASGLRVVAVRHPMPYGNLERQAVQRFASHADLDRERCTIEEREEYEPHIDNGFVVYAGADYERILEKVETEAEVILWDGGNNDLPFYVPTVHICVADPHRAGHERSYYPGETNFRMADLIVINKCDTADEARIVRVEQAAAELNPRATVVRARSPIRLDDPELVRGRRVLVVEDGPTLTHGGMHFGAGFIAASDAGAREIVDPAPFAVGSIRETFAKYPNARGALPAMGYGEQQIAELAETIARTPCDAVVIGTPVDLRRILTLDRPAARARYELEEETPGAIMQVIERKIDFPVPA
ncbi:MAG TPA: cyclic 2,3-diphosphoglycerate synthase [Thermoanaerobaculia bacterium]|nr:cyclic 2,3-diphosphoglycerate synthase [Thermoanaerobaculia bacterium]